MRSGLGSHPAGCLFLLLKLLMFAFEELLMWLKSECKSLHVPAQKNWSCTCSGPETVCTSTCFLLEWKQQQELPASWLGFRKYGFLLGAKAVPPERWNENRAAILPGRRRCRACSSDLTRSDPSAQNLPGAKTGQNPLHLNLVYFWLWCLFTCSGHANEASGGLELG